MLRDKIRSHILQEHMYSAPPENLKDDVSLLETGVFDSVAVMQLIQFLEDEFNINIFDTEFTPENLDSVDRICDFLRAKGISDDV